MGGRGASSGISKAGKVYGTAKLSTKEEILIDKILKKWEDYRRGK